MSGQVWAGGVLLRAGRVLLARRTMHRRLAPGRWDLPGGHAEADEDAATALVRELWEEIGVTVSRSRPLLRVDVPTADGTADYHIFLILDWEGEPTNRQPEEHLQIGWFTLDEAMALDLADARYVAVLRRALSVWRRSAIGR
ncbi:MAG TPA: NUDIX hydrolase [Candidatus Limnocylindria bacterium]